jgi:hypothetical protein
MSATFAYFLAQTAPDITGPNICWSQLTRQYHRNYFQRTNKINSLIYMIHTIKLVNQHFTLVICAGKNCIVDAIENGSITTSRNKVDNTKNAKPTIRAYKIWIYSYPNKNRADRNQKWSITWIQNILNFSSYTRHHGVARAASVATVNHTHDRGTGSTVSAELFTFPILSRTTPGTRSKIGQKLSTMDILQNATLALIMVAHAAIKRQTINHCITGNYTSKNRFISKYDTQCTKWTPDQCTGTKLRRTLVNIHGHNNNIAYTRIYGTGILLANPFSAYSYARQKYLYSSYSSTKTSSAAAVIDEDTASDYFTAWNERRSGNKKARDDDMPATDTVKKTLEILDLYNIFDLRKTHRISTRLNTPWVHTMATFDSNMYLSHTGHRHLNRSDRVIYLCQIFILATTELPKVNSKSQIFCQKCLHEYFKNILPVYYGLCKEPQKNAHQFNDLQCSDLQCLDAFNSVPAPVIYSSGVHVSESDRSSKTTVVQIPKIRKYKKEGKLKVYKKDICEMFCFVQTIPCDMMVNKIKMCKVISQKSFFRLLDTEFIALIDIRTNIRTRHIHTNSTIGKYSDTEDAACRYFYNKERLTCYLTQFITSKLIIIKND